jgi:dTDP-4-amino-4,6-dideoxygalactose transaminase
MRKLIVVVLALALVGISPAHAVTKAGGNCSKAGATSTYTGKKFTCIKSGGKLVWNKGVTVKKLSAIKQGVCPAKLAVDQDPGITQVRANALLTMTEADAEMCAAKLDWLYRVGQRDEELFAGTFDYRTNRVTITVMKGLVTQAIVG